MQRAGFTLMELLVVVVIIGVLTSIAVPQYRRTIDRTKAAEAMQMLPALFDSRERWVEEFQCLWDGDTGAIYNCDGGENFSAQKIDIETKGTLSGNTITTTNFVYTLEGAKIPGGKRTYVTAKPRWGGNRGLTAATIYYNGKKFLCNDGGAQSQHPCDVLNIDDRAGS